MKSILPPSMAQTTAEYLKGVSNEAPSTASIDTLPILGKMS